MNLYQISCWLVSGFIITTGIAFILSIGVILSGLLIAAYEVLDYIIKTLSRHWCLFLVFSLYMLLKDNFKFKF